MIPSNINRIRKEIGDGVLIVPAVKGRSASDLKKLRDAGITDVGENRVQEFLGHYEVLGGDQAQQTSLRVKKGPLPMAQDDKGFKWHFIGQLQSNKVKYIIGKVELIHSLDRMSLAREIDRVSGLRGVVTKCLVEVNMANEPSKGGLPPGGVEGFLEEVRQFKNIEIKGLMTVMPNVADVERYYVELQKLHNRFGFEILSAGMSDDYKLAVKYGANLVRLGRVLFD
jgi:hypothetical protein